MRSYVEIYEIKSGRIIFEYIVHEYMSDKVAFGIAWRKALTENKVKFDAIKSEYHFKFKIK